MPDSRQPLLDPEAAGMFREACQRFMAACRRWTYAESDVWVDAQLARWGDSAIFYNEPPAASLAALIVEMESDAAPSDRDRTALGGKLYQCMEAHRHWNLFTDQTETAAICEAVEFAIDAWRRGV